jgi:hypothetical protein
MDKKILDAIEQILLTKEYEQTTEGGYEWETEGYTIELMAQISSDPDVLGNTFYITLYTVYGMQSVIISPHSLYWASFNGIWNRISEQCFPTDEILQLLKP